LDTDPHKARGTIQENLTVVRNLCLAAAAGLLLANTYTFFVQPRLFPLGDSGAQIRKSQLFVPGFSNTRVYTGDAGISGRFAESVFDPFPSHRFSVGLHQPTGTPDSTMTITRLNGSRDASLITFYFDSKSPIVNALSGWREPDPQFFSNEGLDRMGWRPVPGSREIVELYLEPLQAQSVEWAIDWIYKSLTDESDEARREFVNTVLADLGEDLPVREKFTVVLTGFEAYENGSMSQTVTVLPVPENYDTVGFWWMQMDNAPEINN